MLEGLIELIDRHLPMERVIELPKLHQLPPFLLLLIFLLHLVHILQNAFQLPLLSDSHLL